MPENNDPNETIDRLINENSFLREKIRKSEAKMLGSLPNIDGMTFEGMISHLMNELNEYKKQENKTREEFIQIKKEHSSISSLCLRIDKFLAKK
jgi:hypothetical protein